MIFPENRFTLFRIMPYAASLGCCQIGNFIRTIRPCG
jgi:hypothetical protein